MRESQVVPVSLRPLRLSHPMTLSHPQPMEPSPLRMPPNRLVHLRQLFPQQWVRVRVRVRVSVWAQA